MCVICASKKGAPIPDEKAIIQMFEHNPDGAGYMVARDGLVIASKGYMCIEEYLTALAELELTKDDAVVYHFRISTQAGVNPYMTHPFPLSDRLDDMMLLDYSCPVAIAHNGIIRLTTDSREKTYSDTALFVVNYLTKLIRNKDDFNNAIINRMIAELIDSKMAIMNGTGDIAIIGNGWTKTDEGYLVSNTHWMPITNRNVKTYRGFRQLHWDV